LLFVALSLRQVQGNGVKNFLSIVAQGLGVHAPRSRNTGGELLPLEQDGLHVFQNEIRKGNRVVSGLATTDGILHPQECHLLRRKRGAVAHIRPAERSSALPAREPLAQQGEMVAQVVDLVLERQRHTQAAHPRLKVGDPFRSVVRSITRKVRVQLGDLPVQAPDASAMQSGQSCIGLHKVKGTRWPPGIYREGGA